MTSRFFEMSYKKLSPTMGITVSSRLPEGNLFRTNDYPRVFFSDEGNWSFGTDEHRARALNSFQSVRTFRQAHFIGRNYATSNGSRGGLQLAEVLKFYDLIFAKMQNLQIEVDAKITSYNNFRSILVTQNGHYQRF
ncbi:hypothetical protein J6590_044238 [Homalodisca vitripennis]|nr:hypothetical protein J6590_044238 [Homalodisca vitripennis]